MARRPRAAFGQCSRGSWPRHWKAVSRALFAAAKSTPNPAEAVRSALSLAQEEEEAKEQFEASEKALGLLSEQVSSAARCLPDWLPKGGVQPMLLKQRPNVYPPRTLPRRHERRQACWRSFAAGRKPHKADLYGAGRTRRFREQGGTGVVRCSPASGAMCCP